MTDKHNRTQVILEAVGILLILFVLVAAIIIVANKLDYTFGDPQEQTRVISVLTLFAFGVGVSFFFCITLIGLANWHDGKGFSSLYLPILFFAATMLMWLSIQCINAYDYLAHDGKPVWAATREPEVSITAIALIICFVVVAPGLILRDALKRNGWSDVRLLMLLGGIALATAIVIWIALTTGSAPT